MSSPTRPPEPPTGGVLTKDPVRWSWVIYGFIQTVIVVLLAAEVVTAQQGAIITGIALAVYIAISELFVRPDTVPRIPLEQLAAAQEAANAAEAGDPPVDPGDPRNVPRGP